MKVYLDTNVFLDWLFDRKNVYSIEAYKIMEAVENNIITAYFSSGTIFTITYLLRKSGKKGQELKEIMMEIFKMTNLLEPSIEVYLKACQNDFKDLEDAFQYEIALHHGKINYFITANIKDFKNQNTPKLPIITPKQLVSLLNL